MHSGLKTSELWVTVITIVGSVLSILADVVPQGSIWAIILGALVSACTYIAGRSFVKVAALKSEAFKAAAEAQAKVAANP